MEKHKESQKLYNRNGKPFVGQTSQTKSIISKNSWQKVFKQIHKKITCGGRGGEGKKL